MMLHDDIPPLESVSNKLYQLFGIDGVDSMTLLTGGHLCKNFIVETDKQKFFLKQYRKKMSLAVHQIKHAEQYFAQRGIPVILPINDKFGRPAFFLEYNWYSLFPYWSSPLKKASDVNDQMLGLLGHLLAKIHKAGEGVSRSVQPMLLWDRKRFFLEVTELELALHEQPVLSSLETRIQEMLAKKRSFVESNELELSDFSLAFDTYLHCDFSYQNVFFSDDDSQITAIFDFEKSARGPRAFEVARSMFVCCFDDAWEEKNKHQAAIFLSAYLQDFHLPLSEFQQGIKMYLINLAHQTWLETKILFKHTLNYLDLLDAHARRINHLSDDLDAFSIEIYEKAKNSLETRQE